jgi:glycosyltransferase involved in cell wall biosynthesis
MCKRNPRSLQADDSIECHTYSHIISETKECFRLHICMITSEFPPKSGGVGYYVYNLSRTLVNRGHRVTVITRAKTSKAGSETVEGISVFRVSSFPLYPFHILLFRHFVNSLFRSLQPKPTLVHVHTPLPVPLETTIPLITTVRTAMKIDALYCLTTELSFCHTSSNSQTLTARPLQAC